MINLYCFDVPQYCEEKQLRLETLHVYKHAPAFADYLKGALNLFSKQSEQSNFVMEVYEVLFVLAPDIRAR